MIKKCEVCDKSKGRIVNSKKFNMVVCEKHYKQLLRTGKILDKNKRSMKDSNEVIKQKKYAEICLYNKRNNEIARTKIDLEDVDKIKKYKWYLLSNGYVASGCGSNCILLHRFVMDCPNNMYIDHQDLNPLNNQKRNLNICTNKENNENKGLYSHNTSGYTGVVWDKSREKWKAQIIVNDKCIFGGRFNAKSEAIKCRKELENKYFKYKTEVLNGE
ncbi:MAG: hypothetical protein ACOCRK_08950 [bacterium]